MRFRFSSPFLILTLSLWSPAWGQGVSHQTPPTSGDSSRSVVKRVAERRHPGKGCVVERQRFHDACARRRKRR
jgi:hypothetical protein